MEAWTHGVPTDGRCGEPAETIQDRDHLGDRDLRGHRDHRHRDDRRVHRHRSPTRSTTSRRSSTGETRDLTLAPGDQYVFVVAPSEAGLSQVDVTIIDPDGDRLVPSDSGSSYYAQQTAVTATRSGRSATSTSPTTGTYTVSVDGPPGSSVRIGEIPLARTLGAALRRHRRRHPRLHRRPGHPHRRPGAPQQGEEGQPGPRLRRCARRAPGLRPAAAALRPGPAAGASRRRRAAAACRPAHAASAGSAAPAPPASDPARLRLRPLRRRPLRRPAPPPAAPHAAASRTAGRDAATASGPARSDRRRLRGRRRRPERPSPTGAALNPAGARGGAR